MNRSLRLLLAAVLLALLAACGAKGPLFLPKSDAPAEELPAQDASTDASAAGDAADSTGAEPPVTPPAESATPPATP